MAAVAADIPQKAAGDLLAVCPGCGGTWGSATILGADPACTRCGLTTTEAVALLAPARQAYKEGYALAASGKYAAACARLTVAAEQGGLSGQPEVARLHTLCREAVTLTPDTPSAAEHYADAREAAAQGQWKQALVQAAAAVADAPDSTNAYELHRLCALAASAESGNRQNRLVPPRRIHRGTRLCGPLRVNTRQRSRQKTALSTPAPEPKNPSLWLMATMGGTFILAVVALALTVFTLLRPLPQAERDRTAVSLPAPQATPLIVAAPSVPTAFVLPANLRREYTETQQAANEQQARRWLNAGLSALHQHEAARAEGLANAAYQVGEKTYLAEEALLLAARAADNQNSPRAADAWGRLAEKQPQSVYAPLALSKATRAARRWGKTDAEKKYAALLQTQYGKTQEARHLTP